RWCTAVPGRHAYGLTISVPARISSSSSAYFSCTRSRSSAVPRAATNVSNELSSCTRLTPSYRSTGTYPRARSRVDRPALRARAGRPTSRARRPPDRHPTSLTTRRERSCRRDLDHVPLRVRRPFLGVGLSTTGPAVHNPPRTGPAPCRGSGTLRRVNPQLTALLERERGLVTRAL